MANECYCIAIRKAARKVTSMYDDALAPVGVNLAQFSLLRNIERAAPISLTELGKRTGLDRSTIGRNVKVLERMNLVKAVAGEDQREATLVIAKKGENILRNGAPLWSQAQKTIENALGIQAAGRLRTLLQGL
jgi:DNA-binding MarR family transcriptional regulator